MAAQNSPKLGLFEAIGIELEYMIVGRDGLDVLPVCDQILTAQAGKITSDTDYGDITWSNELVLHVIELKTAAPAHRLDGLTQAFQASVVRINELLSDRGGELMPTAMHPWMDPFTQTRLWPHDNSDIYEAFNRIFDCRGHGWSNVQSIHINLPFANDEEFGRLHAAIRLILPILPALAAASPVVDGRVTGTLDNRLEAYCANCTRIPSMSGLVIPEPVFTREEYQEQILERIYRDTAPYDPNGVLHEEWANARGAIARFDRNTIEIRVIDVQECPAADLAVVAAVVETLRLITEETWSDFPAQQAWPTEPLAATFNRTVREADAASIRDADYAAALGWTGPLPCTAGELWRHLIGSIHSRRPGALSFCARELDTLLDQGPLARRLIRALGPSPSRQEIMRTYTTLCDCLAGGEMFSAGDTTCHVAR